MAKYRFEDLNDMQFQELCQAVLLSQMPELQALPTRQRDGGFDAFVRDSKGGAKVFAAQVKWVADQRQERDPVTWLTGVIKREARNIEAMVATGTKRWTLMTNVAGTSHPNTGTIDRLNRELQSASRKYGLEMTAWWREDLSRRLDSAPWEIKLAYPEMLVGFDAMRAVVNEAFNGGRRSRLLDLLKRAAATEWATDQEVRFKHGELDGAALQDIFLDVSVGPVMGSAVQKQSSVALALTGGRQPHSVVFGAPGQGKSTLSILVAQLHRAALLGEKIAQQLEFGSLLEGQQRVPVRMELRDYGRWISGEDPLDPAGARRRPPGAGPSLESFAAHLIASRSGDQAFSVADLTAVSEWLPILFILDGLDEVGEPALRAQVVANINDLAARHGRSGHSAIFVTSRPNFAGAPEPSTDLFGHYELQPLGEQEREEYMRRWAIVAGLAPREVSDLRRVYSQRIAEPHVRELATNPMQLAILLSLMHRRGESIPADRTQLYQSYMEFFLDRESVTDATVKRYRRQLEAVTAFLGWRLQVEAEGGGSGRASRQNLIYRIKHYLVDLGEEPGIAESLFTAVTQRVWVLSGRVEGSFEFEVQPIREYFAAKHLFDTAPAQTATPVLDRLDRLKELFRRPYWLNVTRFLAGMFTPGEAAGVADALIEETEESAAHAWTRRLGRILLDDGVFDSAPKARERVIRAIHDEVGIVLLADGGQGTPPRLFVGAPSSIAIADYLRGATLSNPEHPLAAGRARLLTNYRDLESEADNYQWWIHNLNASEAESRARRWLHLMMSAGVRGEHLSADTSDALYRKYPSMVDVLLEVGAPVRAESLLETAQTRFVAARGGPASGKSFAADLATVTSPSFLWHRQPILADDEVPDERQDLRPLRRLSQRKAAGRAIARTMKVKTGAKDNTLVWSALANELHRQFGRCWLAVTVALGGIAERRRTLGVVLPGGRPPAFGPSGHPSALMAEVRTHGGDASWWRDITGSAEDEFDLATVALALLTSARMDVLTETLDVFESALDRLSDEWLEALSFHAQAILEVVVPPSWVELDFVAAVAQRTSVVRSFVVARVGTSIGVPFTREEMGALSRTPSLQLIALKSVWRSMPTAVASGDALDVIEAAGPVHGLPLRDVRLDYDRATRILQNPASFSPALVVSAAESLDVGVPQPLLGASEDWFVTPA